jgi:hypothetical protein
MYSQGSQHRVGTCAGCYRLAVRVHRREVNDGSASELLHGSVVYVPVHAHDNSAYASHRNYARPIAGGHASNILQGPATNAAYGSVITAVTTYASNDGIDSVAAADKATDSWHGSQV